MYCIKFGKEMGILTLQRTEVGHEEKTRVNVTTNT